MSSDVIEGVGTTKDLDFICSQIEKLSGEAFNEYNFESVLGEIVYYDDAGCPTEDVQQARFKLVRLINHFDKRSNRQLYLASIKFNNQVTKYGIGSDYSWGSIWAGDMEFLITKFLGYVKSNDSKESSSEIFNGITVPGIVEVLQSQEEDTTVPKVMFLEKVYNFLYDKENWRSPGGDLGRLRNYFKHLILKIDADTENWKYRVHNTNRTMAVFNSKLMSNYKTLIYVVYEIDKVNDIDSFQIVDSVDFLKRYGFTVDKLDIPPVSFIKSLQDLIFLWTLDDFDYQDIGHLRHIIEDRRGRLPAVLRAQCDADIATAILNSVEFSVKMATVDCRYIVPMLHQEDMNIQFLIPLHTSYNSSVLPECALVAGRTGTGKWAIKTILDIDSAYSNARLMGCLDVSWMRSVNSSNPA